MPFSDYIVYVDENGDHGLANIDNTFNAIEVAIGNPSGLDELTPKLTWSKAEMLAVLVTLLSDRPTSTVAVISKVTKVEVATVPTSQMPVVLS